MNHTTIKITLDLKTLSMREANRAIREAVSKYETVIVKNASHIHGLCAGLRKGNLVIESNVGDYLAMLNSGARIIVKGNAGNYACDSMVKGEIVIEGNVGYGLGMYSYGGKIIVKGNADDAVGQLLKGALIVVFGDVGDNVGLYMVGGKIIILGKPGKNLGDWMIRGEIYTYNEAESYGRNTKVRRVNENEAKELSKIMTSLGYELSLKEASKFIKVEPKSIRPFYGARGET